MGNKPEYAPGDKSVGPAIYREEEAIRAEAEEATARKAAANRAYAEKGAEEAPGEERQE